MPNPRSPEAPSRATNALPTSHRRRPAGRPRPPGSTTAPGGQLAKSVLPVSITVALSHVVGCSARGPGPVDRVGGSTGCSRPPAGRHRAPVEAERPSRWNDRSDSASIVVTGRPLPGGPLVAYATAPPWRSSTRRWPSTVRSTRPGGRRGGQCVSKTRSGDHRAGSCPYCRRPRRTRPGGPSGVEPVSLTHVPCAHSTVSVSARSQCSIS